MHCTLGAFEAGAGQPQFAVQTTAPVGPLYSNDLGFATVGSNGMRPEFRGCGDAGTGGTAALLVHHLPKNQTTFFVGGFDANPTPLFGATLVPLPIISIAAVGSGPDGTIAFTFPGGGGPISVYAQCIAVDPGVASGWTFSNALRLNFLP
jgi:hypothetical protein